MSDLVEALRLHAWDDCGEQEIPTHIANIAAARITELETALAEARNAALEEAAKVAEELEVGGKTSTMEWANCMAHARDIAQAIRDMKDRPTK